MYAPQFVGSDGLSGKEKVENIIENLKYHLNEACIGSISEIFDADAPHYPHGCVAQAWGVGEILRFITEYSLEHEALAELSFNS
jgi:glycogen debranching enzyme